VVRGNIASRIGVGAAAALLSLVGAPTVSADHVPGAIYTGRNSRSGPVKLVVSKDGAGLASFTTEIPCPGGDIFLVEEMFASAAVPITGHAFTHTVPHLSIVGSFTASGAAGTIHYDLSKIPGPDFCGPAADLTWTATVDATAPRVSILDGVLVLSSLGVVDVRIGCPEDTGVCSGQLTLETERGLVLGAKRFRAAPGKTKVVDVASFARGMKAAAGRTLRARVVVQTRDEVGNEETSQRTVTLKAGLPDLDVAAFIASKEEGDLCRPGEVHHVRWTVVIRNRGPGAGPPAIAVRVGAEVVTVRRRLGVGQRVTLDESVPGRIRIVLDPRGVVEESNERNNGYRSPSPQSLVCVVVP
jgi:hypothetical protein